MDRLDDGRGEAPRQISVESISDKSEVSLPLLKAKSRPNAYCNPQRVDVFTEYRATT